MERVSSDSILRIASILVAVAAVAILPLNQAALTILIPPLTLVLFSVLSAPSVLGSRLAMVAIPLCVAAVSFVPDERIRTLVVSAIAALVVISWIASHRDGIPAFRAIALLALIGIAARFVPFDRSAATKEVLVLAGGMLLALLFLKDGKLEADRFVVILLMTVVCDATSHRVALFLLLLAVSIVAGRRKSWLGVGLVAIAAILIGKWTLAVLVFPLSMLAREREGERSIFAPISSAGEIVPSFAFLASTILRSMNRLRRSDLVAFLVLVVASFLVRPVLGVSYVLVGMLLIVTRRGDELSLDRALALLLFLVMALLPWSGVVAGTFPLPLSGALYLPLLIASTFLAVTDRVATLRAIAIAVTIVVALPLTRTSVVPHEQSIDRSLSAGEAVSFQLTHPARRLRVVASLANGSTLPPSFEVGTIEVSDGHGAGFRRVLRTRELLDWGALSRANRFFTTNRLPDRPAGEISGYGRDAYLLGNGAVMIESPMVVNVVRISAAKGLPASSRLTVEAVEEAGR